MSGLAVKIVILAEYLAAVPALRVGGYTFGKMEDFSVKVSTG
jgi:hypothetical protein